MCLRGLQSMYTSDIPRPETLTSAQENLPKKNEKPVGGEKKGLYI